MNVQSLIEALETGKHLARFVGFPYRAKATGEYARHTIIVNANYKKVVADSLLELELLDLNDIAALLVSNRGGTMKEWLIQCFQAKEELQMSLQKTLDGTQDKYTKAGQYRTIVPGISINLKDLTCELSGLSHTKVVIEPGQEKEKDSSPKTIAKETIRKMLKVGKFRTFALDSETINTIRLNGQTLELE